MSNALEDVENRVRNFSLAEQIHLLNFIAGNINKRSSILKSQYSEEESLQKIRESGLTAVQYYILFRRDYFLYRVMRAERFYSIRSYSCLKIYFFNSSTASITDLNSSFPRIIQKATYKALSKSQTEKFTS